MSIDKLFKNLEPQYQLPTPGCAFNGELYYRSEQKDGVYCTCSNDTCPYYKNVKNKDLCLYGLGKFNPRWLVKDYLSLVKVKERRGK